MQNVAVCILVFLFMLAGLFLLTDVSIKTLILKREKRISIVNELFSEKRRALANKKDSFFKKHRNQVELAILAGEVKLSFPQYLQVVAVCSLIGLVIGLLFQNLLLSGCMAVCLPFIPYQYLKLRSAGFKQQLVSQMESAISIITNTYLQSDDIRYSIHVSLPNIEHPLNSVLTDLDTDLTCGVNAVEALEKIRPRIESKMWREWIDRLKECQDNHSRKNLLPPIIGDITDIRGIQADLDTKMVEDWREHVMVTIFVLGYVPALRFLNTQWYSALTTTPIGRIIVTLIFVTAFLATLYVLKVNKPINAEV